jgi:hypothetical protein
MSKYVVELTEWVAEGKDGSIDMYKASNIKFKSIREASSQLGVPRSTINRFLKKVAKGRYNANERLDSNRMLYYNKERNETLFITFNRIEK